jgi:hypothetical protein
MRPGFHDVIPDRKKDFLPQSSEGGKPVYIGKVMISILVTNPLPSTVSVRVYPRQAGDIVKPQFSWLLF